ncbi:MAG: DUF2891 domain-containing protein [Chloroflexi bacterium]|nr:DUF2891 domain-containing protein [Chloroflexota bacterium]
MTLTLSRASLFADLALSGITREYPNAPGLVLNSPADIQSPRALHPAFYGCFDWHSSVHGHWMLARLLRLFPNLPKADEIRAALAGNLTESNLQKEADYFHAPNRRSFERTYRWTWLLKLAEELTASSDHDAADWSRNLRPLVDVIVRGYLDFLPKQTYPIRVGTHANTAFGLAFALDYARAAKHAELESLLVRRSLDYFSRDENIPAAFEPGGNDFLSPSLIEADLMTRVLPPAEFADWFHRFLPDLPAGLLTPAFVSDRSDLQLVHLDGLNLSRAWCMDRVASTLPEGDAHRVALNASAQSHAREGLANVASGHYGGEHWLASFAVYMLHPI